MKKELNIAVKAAIEASKEVLKLYKQGFSVSVKEDNSPVTTGDLRANEIIKQRLSQTAIPVLSEESEKVSEEIRSSWKKYWCIDPIDGTKEYVNKTGEYCISIGMLTPETSLLGVLAAPSLGLFYFAEQGIGSYKWKGEYEELFELSDQEDIINDLLKKSEKLLKKPQLEQYTFLTSRSHFCEKDESYYQELKKKYSEVKKIQMGSAIKIGWVVEGRANEYARLSPVNFWDIAGGHAIAKYAGLNIVDYRTGKEITYKNISDLKIEGYIVKNV